MGLGTKLGEPDGSAEAGWICNDVSDHCETVTVEQVVVVGWIEAGVEEGIAFELPDDFTVCGAAGEHKGSAWSGVGAEDWEHIALSFVVQVEEAVPGEDAVEGFGEGEGSHIRYERVLGG